MDHSNAPLYHFSDYSGADRVGFFLLDFNDFQEVVSSKRKKEEKGRDLQSNSRAEYESSGNRRHPERDVEKSGRDTKDIERQSQVKSN